MALAAHRPARPGGRQRAARWLVALLVVALGLYAGAQAFALSVRSSAPETARRLAPGNARILVAQAEALAGQAPTAAQWGRAAVFARAALQRDPLQPSAAAVVGFQAGLAGADQRAKRALDYSQRLSRRELTTHLWAIEYAVSRADIAGALRHYDLALRTSRQAPAILFPVLAGAVASPEIRGGLVPILLRRPIWAAPFVNHVGNAAPDRTAGAALFTALHARGFAFPDGAEASLLGAMVSGRDYDLARRYLARGGGAPDRQSRAPGFAAQPATPSPFDWNPLNDVGLTAAVQPEGDANVFTFSSVASVGGPVLRQLQLLRPGRYEVVSQLAALDPRDAQLTWTVRCVDGAELARFPLTRQAERPVVIGRFAVGPNCPAQWLTLSIGASDEAGGVSGELKYAQVRPAGAR